MKIIVCGGRNYGVAKSENYADTMVARQERDHVRDELLKFHERYKVTEVITGGATGVDTVALNWAKDNGLQWSRCPAQWKKYGSKAAGPIRNRQMLIDHRPDHCIVFPGGVGTEDMRHKSFVSDVAVTIIPEEVR
tara:strand:- start:2138 stop:2542 length:405 start_codon:yes stop_codon:yes gene_type:complete